MAIVNVPYEPIECGPYGPRGAILEIVDDNDRGPSASGPVNLDDPFLLMQQGRFPAPEDRLFRQQMTYAVCTTTYAAFRQALGRDVAWGFRHMGIGDRSSRLRIRPVVKDLQNAFYDPSRGELRFGVFAAGRAVAGRNVPGGEVALCLSHDVVVHEMSHALLDGLRSHFLYPSNPDVLAFHEAFADLIAVFQRFTYRDVIHSAIRASRGDVSCATLLTNIAVQFAQAMNLTGALRTAVAGTDLRYEDAIEPHHRGELLVSAVFEAFTTVYQRKTAPLMRLASGGTGVLPAGEIPELLIAELAERAARLASQFLAICIRAIDYCPPVDITFGEYLRAVITADSDLVPHDEFAYREAWIDAFAKRRIYPSDVPSLSESALKWRGPQEMMPPEPELSFAHLQFDGDPGRAASADEMVRQATAFGQLAADPQYRAEFGLAASDDPALDGDELSRPVVESIRSSRRVGPSGQVVFDLVAEIIQRRSVRARNGRAGFDFYGGATAILDPEGRLRYVIRKRVLDEERMRRQADFTVGAGAPLFGAGPSGMRIPESKLLLRLHDVTRPQLQISVGARDAAREQARGLASPSDTSRKYLLRLNDIDPAVRLLKQCMNRCVSPSPMLDESTTFDENTQRAVTSFQLNVGAAVDGVVGPATWALTGRALSYNITGLTIDDAVAIWIQRLLRNNPRTAKIAALESPGVLDFYEFAYGPLTASQRTGLSTLLTQIVADPAITDLRWAVYMAATVKHECADTWRPIEEYGRGAGRKYGEPIDVVDDDGVKHSNAYYGRGYVQLTWKDNYLEIGNQIGLGKQLMIHPEMALEPDVAYRIMSFGMRHGTFTGKGLPAFIQDDKADYLNARRIINGTDQAQRIEGYAKRIETMLLANLPF
jgi:peptidoglycan hydrolase-like protein with peptidoglycan-binding domain